MTMSPAIRSRIQDLIDQGAVFYCSHSAGKDSQAMYLELANLVPDSQLVVVHADLGVVEWEGVQDHIRATTRHPLHVVRAGKTLFDMVRRRAATRPDVPAWPSSSTRQCTSDLKRDPIAKFIRADMKERGATIGVNCMGIRAQESGARAKKPVEAYNKRMTNAKRTVIDMNPIHDWSEEQVFARISNAGQKPHWAYQENSRLSCVFCIMGCQSDLAHGARQRPELYRAYIELERETGHTMFHDKKGQKSLEQVVGIPLVDITHEPEQLALV